MKEKPKVADRNKTFKLRGIMKRIIWTLSMAVAGLFLGWKGQGSRVDLLEVGTAVIWSAAVGFGFGSIFGQQVGRRWLLIYWAVTLALVGAFFGPLLPIPWFLAQEAVAVVLGALVGISIGLLQLRMARPRMAVPVPPHST
jgi:hypothetical protein